MFFDIYKSLCIEKGLSPNAVAKLLAISSGSVTEWKKGRIPQNSKLKIIAEFFDVSPDYLLGKTDIKNPLPTEIDEEQLDNELIRRLCSLSPEELARVDAFVQGLLANREV